MTEIAVEQRTPEWFAVRQTVSLTASNFGNAIGVGIGHPYDFLKSLIHTDPTVTQENSPNARHGIQTEPIIREAYELLSSHRTQEAGFWLTKDTDPLYMVVGASPDAKVLGRSGTVVGLAEFKAPVFTMYRNGPNAPHGIPRNYMAQIQGQMAVCGLPWCDFMAICLKTKEIVFKRVHYQTIYWKSVSNLLLQFTRVLKEARKRKNEGLTPLSFPAAETLRSKIKIKPTIPGEELILVEDLLQEKSGTYRTSSCSMWMPYDFLIGSPNGPDEGARCLGAKILSHFDCDE